MIEAAEIRFDYADPGEWERFFQLPEKYSLPFIATARLPRDGGQWRADESRRISLLEKAAAHGFSWVDIELDMPAQWFSVVERRLSSHGGKIIASTHHFGSFSRDPDITPLHGYVKKAEALGALPKIAVMLKDSRDLLAFTTEALELRLVPGKRILVAMGEYGVPQRIAYHRFGSMLSFCSSGGKPPAPGQLTADQLEQVYRLARSDKDTVLFGIIGNPVLHTRSPEIHNRGFAEKGLNALYLPFPTDNLDHFFAFAELMDLRGFSVTVPFKEAVLPYLDAFDDKVRTIGSCNTVIRKEGRWYGTNTDYDGFLSPLKKNPGVVSFRKVLIAGAGGAARTVAAALAPLSDHIVVANRNPERARKLAGELLGTKGSAVPLASAAAEGPFDLIVQTTSVGMAPDIDGNPLPEFPFSGSETVYDIIYAPEKTLLLKEAEKAGCPVIGGLEMLQAQGELQFELFSDDCFR
jgi:3-dehydroquinate dehydratase / shikimate dehydrogenase